MRKYLFLIMLFGISFFVIPETKAGFCVTTRDCSGIEQCINGECIADEPGGGTTSTSADDPCLTKVSSSISSSAACDKTPTEDLDDCRKGTNSSNKSYKCVTRYSCETLFTDAATANSCNFARCKANRGDDSSYCQCKYVDKGIPLNTSIPFLGNCLKKTNPSDPNDNAALNAFPTIISVASRILITVIMLVGFVMIVIGGIQWSTGKAADGKKMISKVVVGFALLGAMGAILRLINPNFFK